MDETAFHRQFCSLKQIGTFQFLMCLKEAKNINELLKRYFSRSVPSCCKGILSVFLQNKKRER